MKFRKKDLIIIGVLLAAALALALTARLAGRGDASLVVAKVNGETVLTRSLLIDGRYEIPQEEGNVNIIRIENGTVWMEEANCPDGLCIHQGKMRDRAKNIVCLPHKLIISLEGGSLPDEDVDIILY